MTAANSTTARPRRGFGPETLARAARRTPEPLLRAAASAPFRRTVTAGIFRQMPRQLKPSAARTDATVQWDIAGANGTVDTWYAIFEDGKCRTTRRPPELNPRTTFAIEALDFIRLAAGMENPMAMFQNGRIKISGDLFFAAQVQAMFAIPA